MNTVRITNHIRLASCTTLILVALVTLMFLAPRSASAADEVGSFYVPDEAAVVPQSFPVRADLGTDLGAATTDAYVTIEVAGDPGTSVEAPGCDSSVVIIPTPLPPGSGPNTLTCTLDASGFDDGDYDLKLYVATDDTPLLVDTVSITLDATPPTGGSISYPNATVTSTPIMVSWAAGSDANPGGVLRLDRWAAPITAGNCGTFAYDTTLDHNLRPTGASGIYDDTLAENGYCYRYLLVDIDSAGNEHEITSLDTARFELPDIVAPSVPTGVIIDTEPATGAHVAALPVGTSAVRIAWNASTDMGLGVGSYQWCLMDGVRASCSDEIHADGTSDLFVITPNTPLLEAGKSYVACVRAGDLASNWSTYGCSPVAAIATPSTPPAEQPPVVTPTPDTCTPRVGASMTRSVQLTESFIYTVGDWAGCPFPNKDRISDLTYLMCADGSALMCYQVRHSAGASASSADVRAQGIPLVSGETFGDVNGSPSVRLYNNTKKARTWVVKVTARSTTGATFLLHTWQLRFGTGASACDQSPLTVIADSTTNGTSYSAAAAIACTGSGFSYSAKTRSSFASATVDAKGNARYAATSPSGDTDSFSLAAQNSAGTYERNVTVQFKRYATGTGGGDTMIGSNTNSVTDKRARAKRLTARGDVLLGGGGNDMIHGRGGDDVIHGQVGNDRLHPGSGANITNGGAGNDMIFITSSRDTVIGGAGNDTITIQTKVIPKRISCGAGRDTIIAPRKIRLPKGCERLIVRRKR